MVPKMWESLAIHPPWFPGVFDIRGMGLYGSRIGITILKSEDKKLWEPPKRFGSCKFTTQF
jgi:hypothetical protein